MIALWDRATREVWRESALFLEETGSVSLLFPAEKVVKVYNRATGAEYRKNVDYSFIPGSAKLTRLAGSAIPYLDDAARHPGNDVAVYYPAPGANAVPGALDGRNVRFDASNFFATQQIEVDYVAAKEASFEAKIAAFSDRLPRVRAKLAAGEKLVIRWLGDSISEGYNASKFVKKPPFQPPYAELFAIGLQEISGGEVVLENRGLNGAQSTYPLEKPELIEGGNYDLLVAAFGMNDFFRKDAALYLHNLAEIIRRAKMKNPEVEILLNASMSGNPEWEHTPPEPARDYAKALLNFVQKQDASVAGADLYSVWQQFLSRKSFWDLTGNGVNHPNDYGHRVLANAALSLFAPARLTL